MAGTATRYDETKTRVGTHGQLWAGLAIPGAGGRLTLDTDGTPDATANPNAKHLGMTSAGSTVTIGMTITDHYADEFTEPIYSVVDQTSMEISAALLQLYDEETLKAITASYGTYATASGYKEFAIGRKTLTYTSLALIWPVTGSTTLFSVAHIYKAQNTSGLSFGVDAKGRSEMPVTFKGYGITTRAVTDTLGKLWWQIP